MRPASTPRLFECDPCSKQPRRPLSRAVGARSPHVIPDPSLGRPALGTLSVERQSAIYLKARRRLNRSLAASVDGDQSANCAASEPRWLHRALTWSSARSLCRSRNPKDTAQLSHRPCQSAIDSTWSNGPIIF